MDDKQIDDLVSMIDQFVTEQGGHMNVTVDPSTSSITINKLNSSDCAEGDLACKVPTLFEGMDFFDDSDPIHQQ